MTGGSSAQIQDVALLILANQILHQILMYNGMLDPWAVSLGKFTNHLDSLTTTKVYEKSMIIGKNRHYKAVDHRTVI